MSRETDAQTRAQSQPAETAEGGWLRRWSQRKRQADNADQSVPAAEAAAEQAVATQAPDQATQPSPGAEADELELPPIESLDEHSDYRGFMSDKVSEELRRQALRKLFSLPQFNIRDGLNDYDEDFASFRPLGDTVPHDLARSLARAAKHVGNAERNITENAAPAEPVEPTACMADADGLRADSGEQRGPEGNDEQKPQG